MWTVQFWKDVAERAIKTFVYALLGALPSTAATQPVVGWPWATALTIAGGATLLSVLGSLISLPIGGNGTASLTKAVEPSLDTGKHAASQ